MPIERGIEDQVDAVQDERPVDLVLECAKVVVHRMGWEIFELNRLLSSGIGGAIFIIGFLLSSILADYKEAEGIPADLRNSIEAIDGDLQVLAEINAEFNARETQAILIDIIETLRNGVDHSQGHKNLALVHAQIGRCK